METIRDIAPILPKSLSKLLSDYLVSNTLDRTYFETEGDLDELRQLINNQLNSNNHWKPEMAGTDYNLSNIEMLIKLHDLALASWGLLHHTEFSELQPCKDFKAVYPKLFATILVWGWS